MAIYNLHLPTFQPSFNVSNADKHEYGEIYTPFPLINKMLDLFDQHVFTDANKRWLDAGAGLGYFSIALFDRLNRGLMTAMPDESHRKNHILKQMIHMIELKPSNVAALREMFGETANIIACDFCASTNESTPEYYDYIIGNPPYNSKGMKKVPTNKALQKKADGNTIWVKFIIKSLTLLQPETGQLCLIVPAIWLKPDKAGIHKLLTNYKIEKIHCLTGNETQVAFKGEAQTPTCYFLLTKRDTDKQICLYDTKRQAYVNFNHNCGEPLPMFGAHLIQKLHPWVAKSGLKVFKTNMPTVNSRFTCTLIPESNAYINITSCVLTGLQPTLLLNYSNIPQAFHGVKKLVLAHKMYGFPYYDKAGIYGISNRDNYVITGKTDAEFVQLQAFLSTKLALYLFESTRYRMKYLEKYAFHFIPDVTRLPGFPKNVTEQAVADYFGLDDHDRQHISGFHKKDYTRFST